MKASPSNIARLVGLALGLCSTAATAEITGNDLRGYCRSYPTVSQDTAFCVAYVAGSVDAARFTNQMVKGKLICEPAEVTGQQQVYMTMDFLARHPERLHQNAAALILDMYVAAFPCAERRGK
jgi:hypothetical protein